MKLTPEPPHKLIKYMGSTSWFTWNNEDTWCWLCPLSTAHIKSFKFGILYWLYVLSATGIWSFCNLASMFWLQVSGTWCWPSRLSTAGTTSWCWSGCSSTSSTRSSPPYRGGSVVSPGTRTTVSRGSTDWRGIVRWATWHVGAAAMVPWWSSVRRRRLAQLAKSSGSKEIGCFIKMKLILLELIFI